MKDITRIIIRIVLLFLVLFLVTRVFKKADEKTILSSPEAPYSHGNSPDSIRLEILSQLRKFQDGYSKRDPEKIDAFMQSLYSRDNILILGTMPKEIYTGFENATRLVKDDWESWGDCKFDIKLLKSLKEWFLRMVLLSASCYHWLHAAIIKRMQKVLRDMKNI